MPKFAKYNPRTPQPQPVTGWYDTDNFVHFSLPEKSQLVEVDDETWKLRLEDPGAFMVFKGQVQHKDAKK